MTIRIIHADVLAGFRQLADESVQCVVTSPPYFGLRDYGVPGQIGLEPTPEAYIARLVEVFREVRRVLRPDGVCFVNMGDSYDSGTGADRKATRTAQHGYWQSDEISRRVTTPATKPKDLLMMPSRLALALQADGWWLRSMMPWVKRSCMPESTTDRPTSAIEYIFMLTRSARYYWDADAVRRGTSFSSGGRQNAAANGQAPYAGLTGGEYHEGRPGRFSEYQPTSRNIRNSDLFFDSLELPEMPRNGSPQPLGLICDEAGEPLALDVNPEPFPEAHFATYPTKLVEPLIRAATRLGDTVLDPFLGSGTTALVADRLGRHAIGIELNTDYAAMAETRIHNDAGLFANLDAAPCAASPRSSAPRTDAKPPAETTHLPRA